MPNARTWDKHEIKAEIGRLGWTLAGLAREYGLPVGTCRRSLIRPTPTGDQAISACLGIPLHELWPDRYDAHGHRLVKIKPLRKPRPPATPEPAAA